MSVQIQAPTMGESITEATVARWMKKEGEAVQADELVVELETDKVNLEVAAPAAGVLSKIMTPEGATVNVGDLMGEITEGAAAAAVPAEEAAPAPVEETPAPVMPSAVNPPAATSEAHLDQPLSPAVRRLVEDNNIDPSGITGTGKDGRLTKGDVMAFMEQGAAPAPVAEPESSIQTAVSAPTATSVTVAADISVTEERVPMSRLRKTIAGRLKTAQNNAAMLTTYNEVDLYEVMELRKKYKDKFEKEHGVKLGFMSFFTKATLKALESWPALNAEIDGEELVYKKYYNMGIAVSSDRGLVVPVLKNADKMSFADIESGIREYAIKARDGKIMPDDMAGGTFTITNGGTFGSMMSMPILNYPQVGILGMHNIVERPVVVNGEIVIRPMMYLAMTYDHRIVDGKEAVSFLYQIKELLEDPGRLLLAV